MPEWKDDVRDALRAMRARPGVAAAAVVMLALGIGATTAIATIVKRVLIDPLPYPGADRIVKIAHNIGGIDQAYFNDAITLTYERNAQAFESVGVWSPEGTGVTITGEGDPEEVRALTASRGLFTTLGVRPHLGRSFSVEDDTPGAPGTVMLADGYWRRKFGARPNVLGRTLTIDARPHQIIGVLPSGFAFGGQSDLVLPLRMNPGRPVPFFYLNGIARMKAGVTLAAANADIARMLEIYFDTYKANTNRSVRWVPTLVPLKDDVIGDVGDTLWVLVATIAIVLLMACANVANLLLVRADARRQEFAIRSALGASWGRVARSLLLESILLAALGAMLGVTLAYAGLRALVAFEPANLPRLSDIAIDPAILLLAVAITIACGLLLGLIPVVKFAGRRLTAAVGVSARGTSMSVEQQRSQNVLVTAQIALALVLLVSSGLMIRSFQALRAVAPGFTEPGTLQTFTFTIPSSLIPDLERVTRTQQEILDRISAIAGVTSAAFTTRLPMDPNDRWSAAISVENVPDDGKTPPNHQVKVISPGMFQTMGTPVVAGRDFTWTDLYELRETAMVSENLARALWGSPDAAIGKRIRQYYGAKGAPWREIIGVAANVYDDGVHQDPPATVYWPGRLDAKVFAGYHPRRVSVVVRTDRAGTGSLLDELRQAVWAVNPTLPLAQAGTLDLLYSRSMSRTSFTLTLLAIAAAMALLLGVCGIYGVIAYAVSRRRREIGIRMALGAQAGAIRGLFLKRGVIVAAIGVAFGLGGALGLARFMRAILFGVTPFDPITFVAMPIVLAIAAVLATWLPARRALLVDPAETIRAE